MTSLLRRCGQGMQTSTRIISVQAFRNHQLANFLERERNTRQIHAPLPPHAVAVPLEFPRFLSIFLLISANDLPGWVEGAARVGLTPPVPPPSALPSPTAPSPLPPEPPADLQALLSPRISLLPSLCTDRPDRGLWVWARKSVLQSHGHWVASLIVGPTLPNG